MAELYYNEAKGEWAIRQGLRSPYIDYFHGWFFITIQVANNKSVFGAIVGEDCVLNDLGEAIREAWLSQSQHAAGLQIFDFQVMPNHFHALLYYDGRGVSGGRSGPPATGSDWATPPSRTPPDRCGLKPSCLVEKKYARESRSRDLPYVIGLFKSWSTKLYHRLKAARRCIDIGPKLWQESFYDELVRSDDQFAKTAAYIRNNPRNWNLDRFGAVTSFAEGNLDLLQSEYVAYLSSEGVSPQSQYGAIPCRRWPTAATSMKSSETQIEANEPTSGGRSRPPATPPTVISTFTSYYERQILEKCLRAGRRFIWVCPGGVGPAQLAKVKAALEAGLALVISPVAPGTGVNKQRANWCNQFIAKNAKEIWVGHLRAGGSLEAILKGCGR